MMSVVEMCIGTAINTLVKKFALYSRKKINPMLQLSLIDGVPSMGNMEALAVPPGTVAPKSSSEDKPQGDAKDCCKPPDGAEAAIARNAGGKLRFATADGALPTLPTTDAVPDIVKAIIAASGKLGGAPPPTNGAGQPSLGMAPKPDVVAGAQQPSPAAKAAAKAVESKSALDDSKIALGAALIASVSAKNQAAKDISIAKKAAAVAVSASGKGDGADGAAAEAKAAVLAGKAESSAMAAAQAADMAEDASNKNAEAANDYAQAKKEEQDVAEKASKKDKEKAAAEKKAAEKASTKEGTETAEGGDVGGVGTGVGGTGSGTGSGSGSGSGSGESVGGATAVPGGTTAGSTPVDASKSGVPKTIVHQTTPDANAAGTSAATIQAQSDARAAVQVQNDALASAIAQEKKSLKILKQSKNEMTKAMINANAASAIATKDADVARTAAAAEGEGKSTSTAGKNRATALAALAADSASLSLQMEHKETKATDSHAAADEQHTQDVQRVIELQQKLRIASDPNRVAQQQQQQRVDYMDAHRAAETPLNSLRAANAALHFDTDTQVAADQAVAANKKQKRDTEKENTATHPGHPDNDNDSKGKNSINNANDGTDANTKWVPIVAIHQLAQKKRDNAVLKVQSIVWDRHKVVLEDGKEYLNSELTHGASVLDYQQQLQKKHQQQQPLHQPLPPPTQGEDNGKPSVESLSRGMSASSPSSLLEVHDYITSHTFTKKKKVKKGLGGLTKIMTGELLHVFTGLFVKLITDDFTEFMTPAITAAVSNAAREDSINYLVSNVGKMVEVG